MTLRRPEAVTLAVLAIAAVALVARLWDLGDRAMHHDESLHAAFSWYWVDGRGYEHDPLMHGPLQFHLIAGLFGLLGDSETVARLPAALLGTALVATPLLFRRWLGGAGVIVAAALLAASPSLLYYSRFARNDLLAAVWTVLLFAGVWRYLHGGGVRWLVVAAAALGLNLATKETAYITLAVLLLWLNALLAVEAGGSIWRTVARFPVAWLLALVDVLRHRLGGGPAPGRAADALVVVGTLTAPTLAALVQVPLAAAGVEVDGGDTEQAVGLITVVVLLGGAVALGLAWRPRAWLLCALAAYGLAVPLYASLFTNVEGVAGLFWTSLDYWLAQQDVQRGNQPWFYYLLLVPFYEALALLLALAALPLLVRRGGAFAALLAWWALGTLLALTFAGEKMPWLTTHVALPLALLGGLGAALLLERVRRLRREHAGAARRALQGALAGLAMAALVLVGAHSLRAAVQVSYAHSDVAVEPLIYTQTTPDVPLLAATIDAYAAAHRGREQPIVIDSAQSLHWPWAWYLRHYRNAHYPPAGEVDLDANPEAIVLAVPEHLPARGELDERFAVVEDYRHRAWFPEGAYRSLSWGALFELETYDRLASFLAAGQVSPEETGALEGLVLFPEPLPADAAEALP